MKKCNFTLIELLVVIAIIAILAAMLLPGAESGAGVCSADQLPFEHETGRTGPAGSMRTVSTVSCPPTPTRRRPASARYYVNGNAYQDGPLAADVLPDRCAGGFQGRPLPTTLGDAIAAYPKTLTEAQSAQYCSYGYITRWCLNKDGYRADAQIKDNGKVTVGSSDGEIMADGTWFNTAERCAATSCRRRSVRPPTETAWCISSTAARPTLFSATVMPPRWGSRCRITGSSAPTTRTWDC